MNIKRDTISSLCAVSRRCGGCRSKSTVYASTLRTKHTALVHLLSGFGHVEKTIGAASPFNYRNKVQMAMGYSGGRVISGVYQSSERRVLPTDRCLLDDPRADAIVTTVRELCSRFGIRAYDMRSGRGYLRHVLVRVARATGEIMVVLVTAAGELACAEALTRELVSRHPEITTVVHNINDTRTPLYLGERSIVLYGEGHITDRLCGLEFRISPRSFYQVNTDQTEILYTIAREYASLTGEERVIDAYCGTGTIGLTLCSGAREVIGVELNPDAVRDAEQNAERNEIENVRFLCSDAGRFMRAMADRGEHADVVVTDPPRAGCSREFLEALVTLSPRRVVYVSCNPETLARDLRYLTRNGYTVGKIQGIDMFPFTEHVESVVCLTRK